jgi:hypothetical protein
MLDRGPRLYRHALADDLAVSGCAAAINARMSAQADKVADLSKQIADLDAARTIEVPAAGNLRTAAAINVHAAALAAAAKLRATDDERRQAKRNSLADELHGRGEDPRRPEDREGRCGGRASHRRG